MRLGEGATLIELIHRYDPNDAEPVQKPTTAAAARARLVEGNRRFMSFWNAAERNNCVGREVIPFNPKDAGLLTNGNALPEHNPFAAVLSCSDARVPIEQIFRQTFNELFVVRLAGNVVTPEGVGSMGFASTQLRDSVKLLVALGHRGCGAVIASVDAYMDPSNYPEVTTAIGLRSVVDRILIAVRIAAQALERGGRTASSDGYRDQLTYMTACLNAAHTAMTLQHLLGEELTSDQQVLYGIFDLGRHVVWGPDVTRDMANDEPALVRPPANFEELQKLADWLARQDPALTPRK
jgi:carbonic anhydrase